MYSWDDAGDRVAIAQLNSELRNAHLELLSAHCATHQLRLRYSMEDLARFGQRDVLRKSVQAATALNEYYSSLEKKFAAAQAAISTAKPPALSDELLAEAIDSVMAYLQDERERFSAMGEPLPDHFKARLHPYFAPEWLDRIRTVELAGVRLPPPPFYEKAKTLGIVNLPEIPHMDSLTFLDVIVFNETLKMRPLFHGLVHAAQFEILGIRRYTELFVRSFAANRLHVMVPLEAHAFNLESRFARRPPEQFWVADEVLSWAETGRYEG